MAIIDDEIQSNYVDNYKIKKIYLGSERTSGEAGPFSHSTICFLIFQEYVSVQVEYSNICILDQTERASIDHMIKALIWCEKNNVDLINLSLGSVKRADGLALRKIVNRLAAKGVIFVCSADNDNYITYPACFSNVIGVKADRERKIKEGEWTYNIGAYDGIDVIAHSEFPYISDDKISYQERNSNSFAAPLVTAYIANIFKEGEKIEYYKKRLAEFDGKSISKNFRIDFKTEFVVYNILSNKDNEKHFELKCADVDVEIRNIEYPTEKIVQNINKFKNMKGIFLLNNSKKMCHYMGELKWNKLPKEYMRDIYQSDLPIIKIKCSDILVLNKVVCEITQIVLETGYQSITFTDYLLGIMFDYTVIKEEKHFVGQYCGIRQVKDLVDIILLAEWIPNSFSNIADLDVEIDCYEENNFCAVKILSLEDTFEICFKDEIGDLSKSIFLAIERCFK